MANTVLEIKDLKKSFGKRKVIDGISLEVKEGEIYGFLGPNGSGKTTTIKMILRLIEADSGEIKVNGYDTKKQFEKKTKMKDLRSKESLSAGSPVYRIVTGQRWKLVIAVNEDDYNRMNDLRTKKQNTVQVTFHKDNFVTTVPYLCQKKKLKQKKLLIELI